MLKFKVFVEEKLLLEAELADVAREVIQPGKRPPAASVSPNPSNITADLSMSIKKLVDRYKSSIPSGSTITSTDDNLMLKTKSFRVNQEIDIKTKENIEIKAIINEINIENPSIKKNGKKPTTKKRIFKIIKSNIDFSPYIKKQQPVHDTGIVGTKGEPLKSYTSTQTPPVIYFQSFPDQKNKLVTWLYFYDNIDFVNNRKIPHLFSKPVIITSVT